jgi:hypothetical protein
VLHSLRKPLPVPDGAFVSVSEQAAGAVLPSAVRPALGRDVFARFEWLGLRWPSVRTYRGYEQIRAWLKASRQPGTAISNLSGRLIPRFDHEEVARKRRRNALVLAHELPTHSLFARRADEGCPYYFPLIVEDPGRLRQAFAQHGIQTTTFWGPEGGVAADFVVARRMAQSILCLPVHQDLTEDDLGRIIDATKRVVEVGRREAARGTIATRRE